MAKKNGNDSNKDHATDEEIDEAFDPYTKGAGSADTDEGKEMDEEIMRKHFGDDK